VGGALGIAVMSSIFSARGGYATAQTFIDGLRPALVVGAFVVALAGIAALIVPSARRTAHAGTAEDPERALDAGPTAAPETASPETAPPGAARLEAASR